MERYMRVWLVVCVLFGCANAYLKQDTGPNADSLAALYEYNLKMKRDMIENIKRGQAASIRPDNENLKDHEKAVTAIEQDIIDLGGLYRDDLNKLSEKQQAYLRIVLLESVVKSVGLFILGLLAGWAYEAFRPKEV